jgi:hypothetical protein
VSFAVDDEFDALVKRVERLEKIVLAGAKPSVNGGEPPPPPPGFKSTCFVLARDPKVKPEWIKFLTDAQGFTRLSEKQWKFFAVIHKEVTGNWPPFKRDDKELSQPPAAPLPDGDLPF